METSLFFSIWVFPKIGKHPKMDGLWLMEPICPLFLAFYPSKNKVFSHQIQIKGHLASRYFSFDAKPLSKSFLLVILVHVGYPIFIEKPSHSKGPTCLSKKGAIAARRRCTAASRLPWKRIVSGKTLKVLRSLRYPLLMCCWTIWMFPKIVENRAMPLMMFSWCHKKICPTQKSAPFLAARNFPRILPGDEARQNKSEIHPGFYSWSDLSVSLM